MIRIGLFNVLLTFVLISLYSNINIFIYFINGISYLFDFNSRVNINDSLINSFNFFWTSFTYLPIFFFLPLLILIYFYNIYNPSILLISSLIYLIIFSFETVDFLITNYIPSCYNINIINTNLLLANNLNKYHPFIFYLSVYIIIFLVIMVLYFFIQDNLFVSNIFESITTKLICFNLPLNFLALFLGSWWALQEGTWGGWWNWDASEVFGLLISLYSIYRLHLSRSVFTNWQSITSIWAIWLLIVFVYFFIQLNFDLVSHNFGSRFFYFFSNNLFFIEALMIIILLFFKTLYTNTFTKVFDIIFLKKITTYLNLFKINYWLYLIILVITFLIIVNSFLPLWNYFVWNYLYINNFNFVIPINILIIFLLLILTQYFSINIVTILLLALILNSFNSYSFVLFIPFLVTLNSNKINIIHLFIILFLTININSWFINFIQWYNLNLYTSLLQNYTLLYYKQTIFICDYIFVEKLYFYTNTYLNNFNLWNIYFKSNSCTLSSFFLYYSIETFFNHFLILHSWVNTILYIETNLLNNLIDICSTSLLFFFIRFLWNRWLRY